MNSWAVCRLRLGMSPSVAGWLALDQLSLQPGLGEAQIADDNLGCQAQRGRGLLGGEAGEVMQVDHGGAHRVEAVEPAEPFDQVLDFDVAVADAVAAVRQPDSDLACDRRRED